MRRLLPRLGRRPTPHTTPTSPAEAWRQGERLARQHLRRAGMKLIARNMHVAPGEADLVFASKDRKTLVIVEVKARVLATGNPRRPEDAITAKKRAKLVAVARAVARQRKWAGPVRIDVVAVEWRASDQPSLRHYERAVTLAS